MGFPQEGNKTNFYASFLAIGGKKMTEKLLFLITVIVVSMLHKFTVKVDDRGRIFRPRTLCRGTVRCKKKMLVSFRLASVKLG